MCHRMASRTVFMAGSPSPGEEVLRAGIGPARVAGTRTLAERLGGGARAGELALQPVALPGEAEDLGGELGLAGRGPLGDRLEREVVAGRGLDLARGDREHGGAAERREAIPAEVEERCRARGGEPAAVPGHLAG